MLGFYAGSKKNKLIKVLIILLIITLMALFIRYLHFNIVRTDESIMNEVEFIKRQKVILDMLRENKEYRTEEMMDIVQEYNDTHNKITVNDNFDYIIVKQQYKIDKKVGWMPVGIPEFQIFYKTN